MPVLLFLDISGGELLVILLVVFLVFGPEKMPEMARKAGRLMNQMKKATNDLTNEFKKETSVIQDEINAAHRQVNSQVESVNREFNRTKAQIVNDMATDTKPAGEKISMNQNDAEPAQTAKLPSEPSENTKTTE